jgi:F-type H+-transporting ATPase subunit b
MFEAEFWVAVATIIFFALLVYMGVHTRVFEALDARRDRIEAELNEARRLKEEAAQLVATYRQKQAEAEREAAAMIDSARVEAERYAADARTKLDEFVVRRTKMAETKIAQAEVQALADVRAAAAEAAIAAAGEVMTHSAKGKTADDLIARSISDVKSRLN